MKAFAQQTPKAVDDKMAHQIADKMASKQSIDGAGAAGAAMGGGGQQLA